MTSATGARAALALLVAGVSSTLVLMTLPVFVGAIANDFDLTDREAGWLASADMTGSAIASLCIIPLIGRLPWRGLACFALVIAVVGNLLSIIAATLPAILVARFLAGAGGGIVLSLAFVGLCRSGNPDRFFGLYVFLQLSMQALALMAFPVILARFGLDAIFIVFAVVAAACAALVPFFPGRMPAFAGSGTGSSPGHLAVSAGAALGLLSQGIYFLAPGAVWGYLERIGQGFSLSLSQVAYALSVSTVAGLAAAVLVVAIGSRVPRGRALFAGSVLSIFAVTLLIEGTGLVRFMVASLLFNFAWNATFPYQMGVLASLDRTGAVAVLSLLTQLAGLALGPLLASTLLSTSGYDGILLACIACYVVSLLGFAASTRLP